MSSLNITVEIKAPRLCLIKTQKIKAFSCLWQNAGGPSDVCRPLSGLRPQQDLHSGALLTHITSRRVLISESDNNYHEEYTQNDFFVIFMLPQHKEGEITALGGPESLGRLSQELGLRLNSLCHSGAAEQVGRKPASLLYRVIMVQNTALTER